MIEDPALNIALPPGWQTRSPAVARKIMAAMGVNAGDPNIALIDAGRQRMMAIGLAPVDLVLVTVRLLVLDGDPDLGRAVERSKDLAKGITVTRREESRVTLPIGPASRAIELRGGMDGSGAVPSRNITYVVLVDGRTLILTGTSPETDTEMVDLMATMAATLARRAPARTDQAR